MKRWKLFFLVLIAFAALAVLYGAAVIRRGFSAADQPSAVERVMARTVRNLGIPRSARNEKNPWTATPDLLREARENFTGPLRGLPRQGWRWTVGDRPESLSQSAGFAAARNAESHATAKSITSFRTACGLTGMPALGNPHSGQDDNSAWKLVLFIRSIGLADAAGKNRTGRNGRLGALRRLPRRARNATRKFTSAGRIPRWPTWCAIRASIRTRSFPIWPPIM